MSGMTCCLGKAQPHSPELLLGWVLPWERDGGFAAGLALGGLESSRNLPAPHNVNKPLEWLQPHSPPQARPWEASRAAKP